MQFVRDWTALQSGWVFGYFGEGVQAPAVVSYRFYRPDNLPDPDELSYASDKTRVLSTMEKDRFRAALDQFERAAGLIFVETTGAANVSIVAVEGSGWGGWADYPDPYYVSTLVLDDTDPSVMLHEIGHAVGLKHPFEGDPQLVDTLDDQSNTIMSYTGYSETLGYLDIQALRNQYGAPFDPSSWRIDIDEDTLSIRADGGANQVTGNWLYNNHLYGLGGDDYVTGEYLDDFLDGGAGNDTVLGLDGNDTLVGGDDNDELLGAWGSDTVYGGAGTDTLWGGDGYDLLGGGPGDDQLSGGLDDDTLYGGPGEDILQGGDGHDRIGGFLGNDSIMGGRGQDTLWGAQGDDTVLGGSGADTIGGGDGNDMLLGAAGRDEIWGAAGHDTLEGGEQDDRLGGGPENDILRGGAGQDAISGGTGQDALSGEAGNDSLYGAAGDDTLDGGPGRDVLYAGDGADEIIFSKGADTVYAFSADEDVVNLSGASGITDYTDLRDNHLTVSGPHVLVQDAAGHLLTLTDTLLDALTEDNFLFLVA